MFKAILYDLDGTLADTDPIHFQTWKQLLQDYGLDIDLPFYRENFSGRLNPDIVRDLLPHLSEDEGRQLSDRKEAMFRENARQQLQPLAGLHDLIAWGREHQLHQAVVTNAPEANAKFTLETLRMTQTFEFVILGDNLPQGKPHPLPYQTALDRLGLAPEEAVTFEDSPSGVRSSVAANILTVGITTTHPPEKLMNLGAVLAVDDFTDRRVLSMFKDTMP